MEIGRKIYFDKATGNVILDTGEMVGDVVKTTREQDFASFKVLNERVEETVGMIELEFGQYNVEFRESWGRFRVNLETEELEFLYTNPEAPEEPTEPVYQKPLTEQIKDLTTELSSTQMALADNYEQLLSAQKEAVSAQLALTELYELVLPLTGGAK
ncbi:hypothetical protein NYE80_30945 [Paenibacillus sp. FSL H7-0357]|uniref:hypothetical protein n=1 Tax=Paenibacillus sp. FSL H7-0357 TaxID=1536774 RepID=UPI0007C81B6C|nr:hypothetical protein [Paenibacillus sp. FSL H7-0357]